MPSRRTRVLIAAVLVAATASAASATRATESSVAATPGSSAAASVDPAAIAAAVEGMGEGCDPLDGKRCLLPFPSDQFTVADPSTPTGLRVNLPAAGMPVNAKGVAIDPTEWNLNDGFSPNAPMLTAVDGIDKRATALPGWDDLGASLADDAKVVLVDHADGSRVALWAEIDAHAVDPADRLVTIYPAVALREGHTYAVALRDLRRADSSVIEPGAVFRAIRDDIPSDVAAVEARRASLAATFAALGRANIGRDDLYLAWSFTVGSTTSITGRMISIRDQALAQLGDVAPAYTVTAVTPNSDEGVAVQMEGTYTVPNFLANDGSPGSGFFYSAERTPASTPSPNPLAPTLQAPFVCNISVATMNGTTPAHLVAYGHGLLGDNHEINAGNVRAMSNEHNAVYCATKWAGMSEDDIPNAVEALNDFGHFPTVADRLQQGVLNQIFLGRLMTRPGGLADDINFKRADGSPLVDRAHLDYDGNSQGAIMGLMLTAVSPDIERSVLGVASMNYSLLLPRSVDFATYEAVFKPAYPNDLDRVLILSIIQMLWDRGEGAGYVQHVTRDPLPGSKVTPVLVHVAFGDWQVSELAAFAEARTLGIPVHRPIAAPGRSGEIEPGWGLESIVYGTSTQGLVIWDSGSEPIPFDNVPPSVSRDPHEDPRADPDVRRQKAAFLFDDTLIDVCSGGPCTADQRL